MRIGTGSDIHRLVPGRALVLGGITIPSEKGCLGHSDGDALIHAIIDAILGSQALGDIGKLFPDTDPKYKNVDSTSLLCCLMSQLSFLKIINIDSTVILQTPKIGAYTGQMQKKLADILGIDVSCISIKAKTAEHILCELGTGDAVMAEAIVLVE